MLFRGIAVFFRFLFLDLDCFSNFASRAIALATFLSCRSADDPSGVPSFFRLTSRCDFR